VAAMTRRTSIRYRGSRSRKSMIAFSGQMTRSTEPGGTSEMVRLACRVLLSLVTAVSSVLWGTADWTSASFGPSWRVSCPRRKTP